MSNKSKNDLYNYYLTIDLQKEIMAKHNDTKNRKKPEHLSTLVSHNTSHLGTK